MNASDNLVISTASFYDVTVFKEGFPSFYAAVT